MRDAAGTLKKAGDSKRRKIYFGGLQVEPAGVRSDRAPAPLALTTGSGVHSKFGILLDNRG